MANAGWTIPYDHMALPLNERVSGGRGIWLIGRLLIAVPFLMSGVQKLMGLDQFAGVLVKSGIPENMAPTLALVGAAVETLGASLIILGLATGWASLLMIAFTVAASFIGHRFWEYQGETAMLQMSNFIKNVMLVGAFCLLYVARGGPCSIDRWWRDHRDARLARS